MARCSKGNVKLHSSCAFEEGDQRHIENKGETRCRCRERKREQSVLCGTTHIGEPNRHSPLDGAAVTESEPKCCPGQVTQGAPPPCSPRRSANSTREAQQETEVHSTAPYKVRVRRLNIWACIHHHVRSSSIGSSSSKAARDADKACSEASIVTSSKQRRRSLQTKGDAQQQLQASKTNHF